METKEVIPIFFTIDDKYVPYLSVAINSIEENASNKYNYEIIVIYQKLSKENIEKIKVLEKENFTIKFVYMQKGLESITDRKENRLRCDYFTLTIYFRLFIPEMFQEFDKGIYIDSDIVVPGDISELYNYDLKENIIGAAADRSVVDIPEIVNYMENYIGVGRHEYINSGVLLMNLKKMREVKFSQRFLELLNKYHFDSIAPDQDYLNVMCNGKILYLDEVWDAMPIENKEALKNPKLIHYNLFQKPWCYDNIKYEEYFWKYAKQSNCYKEILKFKESYSEEQKKSDEECMNILINKANSLPDSKKTFKKIFESGVNIRI